jgi:hypothetical protein
MDKEALTAREEMMGSGWVPGPAHTFSGPGCKMTKGALIHTHKLSKQYISSKNPHISLTNNIQCIA